MNYITRSVTYDIMVISVRNHGSEIFPRLKVVTSRDGNFDKIKFSCTVPLVNYNETDKEYRYFSNIIKSCILPTSLTFDSLYGFLNQFKEECLKMRSYGKPVDGLSDGIDDGIEQVLFYKIKK